MLSTQVGFGVTKMTPTSVDLPVDFFRRTSLGDKLDKFLFETVNTFVTMKLIIVVPVLFSDIYTMIMLLSQNPLHKPLR